MSVHAFMQSMYFYVQYCGIEIDHISLGYPVSHDFINIWIKTFYEIQIFIHSKDYFFCKRCCNYNYILLCRQMQIYEMI